MPSGGNIRVGIGGWNFAPWRGVFYPQGLPHAQELHYASRQLTTIEINSTFYGSQSPATFAKWRKQTPDGFVFSVKGPRFATNRKVLAEAGESIARFLDSGVLELDDRLGPLLWQFAPTKKFDAADFEAFLALLPRRRNGTDLRHVVEVRHNSFSTPAFIAMLRSFSVSLVYTDHATYPALADITGDFVYARLQDGNDTVKTAYPKKALEAWAERARLWAAGSVPRDLPTAAGDAPTKAAARDVFVYFIHEGKVRAPAAAMTMLGLLGR